MHAYIHKYTYIPLLTCCTIRTIPYHTNYIHTYIHTNKNAVQMIRDKMIIVPSEVEEAVDIFEGLEVDGKVKESILSYVKRRLAPQPVKIRSDIEVTCFTYEGIDAIKQALSEGEAKGIR